MPKDTVPVNISRSLYEKIEAKVKESKGEFKNVEEFVEFVLSEVVKEEGEENVFTPEEEEEIKKRLRALGYL